MHRLLASLLCLGLIAAGSPALGSEAAPAPPPRERAGAATHLINLALLVAGNDATDGGDPLPAPVAKAVGDIKDFLPYKNYKMFDSVVIRTANLEPVRVNLQGPDGTRYFGSFAYQLSGDAPKLNFTRFDIVRVSEPPAPPPRASGADEPTPQAPAPPDVISTGFTVGVGETIVVGTSRLKGTGKALVVVLTVLPAK